MVAEAGDVFAEAGEVFCATMWRHLLSLEEPWDRETEAEASCKSDEESVGHTREEDLDMASLEQRWEPFDKVRRDSSAMPEPSAKGFGRSYTLMDSDVETSATSGVQSSSVSDCDTPPPSFRDVSSPRRVTFNSGFDMNNGKDQKRQAESCNMM